MEVDEGSVYLFGLFGIMGVSTKIDQTTLQYIPHALPLLNKIAERILRRVGLSAARARLLPWSVHLVNYLHAAKH
jgi:hypothetical protein